MFEAFAIRLLWIKYALQLKKTPGLCPPQCRNSHTYIWPCRARVRGREHFMKLVERYNPFHTHCKCKDTRICCVCERPKEPYFSDYGRKIG